MLRGRQTGEKKSHLQLELSVRSVIKPVVGLLKMSFTIKSLKNAMPRREIAKDLPSFNYENVDLREQIGHGAYGMICQPRSQALWYVRVNTINSIMRLLLLKSFRENQRTKRIVL